MEKIIGRKRLQINIKCKLFVYLVVCYLNKSNEYWREYTIYKTSYTNASKIKIPRELVFSFHLVCWCANNKSAGSFARDHNNGKMWPVHSHLSCVSGGSFCAVETTLSPSNNTCTCAQANLCNRIDGRMSRYMLRSQHTTATHCVYRPGHLSKIQTMEISLARGVNKLNRFVESRFIGIDKRSKKWEIISNTQVNGNWVTIESEMEKECSCCCCCCCYDAMSPFLIFGSTLFLSMILFETGHIFKPI